MRIPALVSLRFNQAGSAEPFFGMWRSWLARSAGGREVAGSSPVIPTNNLTFAEDAYVAKTKQSTV